MTTDEIMMLDLDGINLRMSEIDVEIDAAESLEVIDRLKAEINALEERQAAVVADIEKRKADAKAVAHGSGAPVET